MKEKGGGLLVVVGLDDFNGHVVDGGVVENDNAAVGTGFDVNATIFAELIVASAKVVAHGLNGCVQFVCDLTSSAIGQAVFDATELVEVAGIFSERMTAVTAKDKSDTLDFLTASRPKSLPMIRP